MPTTDTRGLAPLPGRRRPTASTKPAPEDNPRRTAFVPGPDDSWSCRLIRSRPALVVEREDLQFDGQVDLPHRDRGRDAEHGRGEVEDRGDSRGDHAVG